MNIGILSNKHCIESIYKKILSNKSPDEIKIIDLESESLDERRCQSTDMISIFEAVAKTEDSMDYILVPSFMGDDVNIIEVVEQVQELGFDKIKFLIIPINVLFGDDKFNIIDCFPVEEYSYLDYLEISITDYCNLKCNACSHFCNLVEEKEFPQFKNYKRDFIQLKKLIPHVFKIRIMGGEPLLNPDLSEYIHLIKEVYPQTDLRICTNGTLILKQDQRIFNIIKQNNVTFDISVYPPLFNQMDNIIKILEQFEIGYNYEIITRFKPILRKSEEKYAHKKLVNCQSINLKDGYLAPCPVIFNIDYYNKRFKTTYPCVGGKINIYNPNLRGNQILRELKKPFNLCNYCVHHRDDLPFFEWRNMPSSAREDDWVVKEE